MGQGGGIAHWLSADIVVTGRARSLSTENRVALSHLTPPGFITTAYSPACPPACQPEPDPLVGTGACALECGCRLTDWRKGVPPMSIERDLHACPVHDRRRRERSVAHDAVMWEIGAGLVEGLGLDREVDR